MGHNTDNCFKLRHAIQDLIDQGKIPNLEYAKLAQEVKKVMMNEDESVNEEFLMKHFELVQSKKRAKEEENYCNLDKPSLEFDYVIAYNPPVIQIPFKEVVPPD